MNRNILFLGLLAFSLAGCTPAIVPEYPGGSISEDDDTTSASVDEDGDGIPASVDCDDADSAVGEAGYWYLDQDQDGHGGSVGAPGCLGELTGGSWVDASGDCDDQDSTIYPDAPELCNGVSDDCDLAVDEGFDVDADGWRTCDEDCNDADATIYPGALETCDGGDQDCDGEVDEEVLLTFYGDWDNDGYGDPEVVAYACSAPPGFLSDSTDCDDSNFDVHPGASEVCDLIDNDCDGDTDDSDGSLDLSTRSSFFGDVDGDGYGDPAANTMACTAPSGSVMDNTDCDDAAASTYPGAPEVCDSADNDCDDTTDENLSSSWYTDADGDGFGSGSVVEVICGGSTGSLVDNQDDCNDSEPSANPAVTEVCDAIDNDCDGTVDEIDGNPDVQILWDDDDGDGFGDETVGSFISCPADGFVLQGGDCNDTESLANPGQAEVGLDGIDNDCDGSVDENGIYCCLDVDEDGFGNGDSCVFVDTGVCNPGYVEGDGDCNDANFSYHPYALDILGDGEDTDCDLTDE